MTDTTKPGTTTSRSTTSRTARRRRRRMLLVPLLGAGVAAWVVRRRLGDGRSLDEGWQPLPPAPHPVPPLRSVPPAPPAPEAVQPVTQPAVQPAASPTRAATPRREGVTVPTATATAVVAAPALPDAAGSLPALPDGSSPDPDYVVKGKTATKAFHVPGGAYYTRTRADLWFRTPDDARAAGFTERVRRSG